MIRPKILAIILLCVVSIQAIALPLIIKPTFALPPISLTAQTDKASYYLGENVKISGEVREEDGSPISGATIGIEVKDSGGSRIFLDGTWSQANGFYQDQFRLPAVAPLGEYRLYVTANKPGYASASKQASFFVTTPELGHTTLKIISHTIELSENNIVTAKQNVTMFSKSITTTTISHRLILLSPSGAIKYDNFLGIGTTQDLRKITITNDTTETVTFEFTLSTLTPGYYIHMFCIFDEYGSNRLDATPWSPAFLYTPPPKHTQDLGTFAPNSQITTSLSITLKRYESAQFSLILTQPIRSLTINVGATSPSKLLISLNQSTNTAKQELVNSYQWTIYNLPSGPYTLNLIALSDSAYLSNLSLQSTNQITGPSVAITDVEATTKIATPGGTVSYHLSVEWDIITDDSLNVSAFIQGAISGSEEIEITTLSFREKDFYLSVIIPSDGIFEILFTAELEQAGVSAQHTTSITSHESEYNITVLSSVTYYKQPSFWEWIWGARTPKCYQDQSQLSILDVQDIKIVDVGLDQQNNPMNVTIEFSASNKAGSWLSFGDGPHYDVWLLDSLDYRFQVGVIFAGDSAKKCYATLPIGAMQRLSFTIYFKISLWAETICLTFSAVEVLISVYTAGLSGVASQFASDITKLTALYIYEAVVESERGYMTKTDIGTILLGSGIPEDIVDLAEELFLKNNFNPAYAILSALVDGFSDKQIDAWTFATAIISFILYMINRSKPDLASKALSSFNKACQKYLVEVPQNLQKIGLSEVEKFLRNVGIIFSIARLVKIVYDLWTCPPEEGKIINSRLGTESPIDSFDPIIKINYEGSSSNTSLDYFGDVQSVHFSAVENTTYTTAIASFTVDPNMTANYLEIMSQPAFQKALLRSMGFNATSSNLEWQNETNTFLLEGNGSMFEGLHGMSFSLDSTAIQGSLEMSADAVPVGAKALLNVSLLYPFGKNLSHTIQTTLPLGSTNISVLSPGSYMIQNNTITWNEPVDWMTVEFIPPSINTLSPQNKTYYSNAIPLTFAISEPTTWIGYSLDDQANVTIDGNTIINVADGPHKIVIYANGTSGSNLHSEALYFTVKSSQYLPWQSSFIGLGGYPIVAFAIHEGKIHASSNNNLYVYDGSSWDIINAPTYITSLASYNNRLVIGGQGGLYVYDGATFTQVFQVSTYIKTLGEYNNILYAGTFLDKPPTLYYCNGAAENPANWHIDTNFSAILIFSGPFGSIDSFTVYDDNMYVNSGGTVYCYNGTDWSIIKIYDDVYAYLDMKVYNSKLYLATRDQAWRKPFYQGFSGFSGRVIEFDGNNWTTVFDHDYWIYSLETYNGMLYAGTANKIFTYNGTDWEVSFESTEGAYYAISLKTYDGKIYDGMGNGYIFEDPSFCLMEPETITVPEFPSFFALPLFMIATLLAVIVYRRKRQCE